MKIILLSGGSGQRLWPLSNEARAKQFLKVLTDAQGQPESMIQRVWRQLKAAGLADDTVVAVSCPQVAMIHKQLDGNPKTVVEPEQRDTFAAIALSAAYLYTMEKVPVDEIIAVLPIDALTQGEFFTLIREKAEPVLRSTSANLLLIGAEPDSPSEKYGYIVPEENSEPKDYRYVARFKEKPQQAEALDLIEKGALWNCGVFCFQLKFLLSKIKELGLSEDYSALLADYQALPKQSFDYAVVEKTEHRVVLPYAGKWKDLGTWNTLTEEMTQAVWGNGLMSGDCRNTHLINELDTPVLVQGINNAVVAVSPDGVLVTDKQASLQIKGLVAGVQQRPMYEERFWGWYKVLEHARYSEPEPYEILVKRLKIEAGKNLSYQKHHLRDETWIIIRGEGEFALEGTISKIQTGDVLKVPRGVAHSIRAITDLEIVESQSGSLLVEEDIERLFLDWADIQAFCRGCAQ